MKHAHPAPRQSADPAQAVDSAQPSGPGLDVGQPGRPDQGLVAEADMDGVDRALEVALHISHGGRCF